MSTPYREAPTVAQPTVTTEDALADVLRVLKPLVADCTRGVLLAVSELYDLDLAYLVFVALLTARRNEGRVVTVALAGDTAESFRARHDAALAEVTRG